MKINTIIGGEAKNVGLVMQVDECGGGDVWKFSPQVSVFSEK